MMITSSDHCGWSLGGLAAAKDEVDHRGAV